MLYTLIIPIYNEIRTVKTLLKELTELDNHIDIIIIDDGSNDGSSEILKNSKNIDIIKNEINLGKGASIKKGLEQAKNKNIIIMDSDLEVDIKDIPRLIKKFESSPPNNAIVGIRWDKNKKYKLTVNRLGNLLINICFNFFYKSNLNDILCCYKIINRDLINSFNLQSDRFNIETEIMANLIINNIDIKEVKIQYNRRTRKQGKKIKFTDSLGIIFTMIKLRLIK